MDDHAATVTDDIQPVPVTVTPATGPDVPLIVASPHSGRAYPTGFLASSRLTLQTLRRSEDCLVDRLVADAPRAGATLITAGFPRAFCDVNREALELDPGMFDAPLPGVANTASQRVRAGFGMIARIVSSGEPIYRRRLPPSEAQYRIDSYWTPYHRALRAEIDATIDRHGLCLLLDIHSMPSLSPSRAHDPDVILGDAWGDSCDASITAHAEACLRARDYAVRRNDPYAGGFVTRHYGRPAGNCHVLQIEFARSLYLDERRFARAGTFNRLKADLDHLMLALGEHAAMLRTANPDAAEKKAAPGGTAKFREETSKKQCA